MTYKEERTAVEEAIKLFPAKFKLKAWPNDIFRISKNACFFSEGRVMLYTARYNKELDQWQDFAKGTIHELQREVLAV
jgi:hypothetical protein